MPCHACFDELAESFVAQPPSAERLPRHSGGPLCHTTLPPYNLMGSRLVMHWHRVPVLIAWMDATKRPRNTRAVSARVSLFFLWSERLAVFGYPHIS